MKTVLAILLIGAAFVGGYGYGRWYGVPVEARGAAPAAKKVLYWVDPMHPWYKSDKPGTAPDCGMKLVPVYEGETQPGQQAAGEVHVSAEKQQLIGVQYGTVQFANVSNTIRAAARVTLDETRIYKVQTRTEGWVDRVFADFTGQFVKKGDPMLTVYSPDALATEQEYLLAIRAQHMVHDGMMAGMSSNMDALVDSAKKRLALWDISDAQIEQIARTGKPIENLTVYAPAAGFITERNAYPKQHVTPDAALYTIADLSSVWVLADVFEYEAGDVRMGEGAKFTVESIPGRVFYGKVSYILPQVDPATRTLKVRIALPNPGNVLKPDMYGQVELQTGGSRRLVVPQSAVLDSGDRQTVFVDRGNGNFEPREVKVGDQTGDQAVILSGLQPGERIVTSGNFLLDSGSQLKAATGGMGK
jgi:Cu(I)/Ag(I) efflux system membrane fusion protein